ncbi:MAG TPA: hydrolase, partial [Candidatus Avoscillospira stercoripullorum]|nr:hydrolase [Candidatus Avoscillospira stercoripullorum]
PIIATGGPTDDSIAATIAAGANAITWTPPSSADIFRGIMDRYRRGLPYEEE